MTKKEPKKIKFTVSIVCNNCGNPVFEDYWKAPSDKYDHLVVCGTCGFTSCFRAIAISKEVYNINNQDTRKDG